MIITFSGLQSFKIQFGETVLAVNPASKRSSSVPSPARFGADLTLVSLAHPDFDGVENTQSKGKEPFVIEGPGEYEAAGVTVTGIRSPARYEGCQLNTVYTVSLEEMNLCFLGGLAEATLPSETLEQIDGVDILFVPIAGGEVLDPSEAYRLAVKLEANVVIPSHYTRTDDPVLSQFLREGGEDTVSPSDRFTAKKRDVEGRSGDIVVLTPSHSS